MNTIKKLILIFTIAVTSAVGGCKSGGGATSSNASSSTTANKNQTPAVAETNSNSSSGSATQQTTKPSEPAQLIGTYQAREIQDKGVVTLMSKIKTLISFSADGTFARASRTEGKTYHTDSGLFRIEPPDKLVLTIQISKKEIQNPPVVKKHTYSLSPDGDQLTLTNDKGSTAIFQRVGKPKQS
jgi:hypothetical protein